MADECEERNKLFLRRVDAGEDDMCVNFLAPIKKEMYQCCLKCTENDDYTDDDYVNCLYGCYMKTSGANYYISSSFDDLRRRFKTCVGKCDSGAGFNHEEDDDEGDDGEVTAEELKEHVPPVQSSEFLLDDYLMEYDNDDLEYPEPEPEMKEDLKDRKTCTRLCIDSYVNTLEDLVTTMRRDLSATFLAKTDLQGYFYDWSKTLDRDSVF